MDSSYIKLLSKIQFFTQNRDNYLTQVQPEDREMLLLSNIIKNEVIDTADMVEDINLKVVEQDKNMDQQIKLINIIMD